MTIIPNYPANGNKSDILASIELIDASVESGIGLCRQRYQSNRGFEHLSIQVQPSSAFLVRYPIEPLMALAYSRNVGRVMTPTVQKLSMSAFARHQLLLQ